MKRVIVTQSNYIPWKGYFDSMALVDEFILYDDVQYNRRSWRNRNLIKTPQGLLWLTIPVEAKFHHKIREVKVSESNWARKHLGSIRQNYIKSRYFRDYYPILEELYQKASAFTYLTDINYFLLQGIRDLLGITTPLKFCWEYAYQSNDRSLRLLEICQSAGATDYYTGPAAKAYMDVELFERNGIRIHWLDYSGYPEYPQLYPPFKHEMSIIDLLLNCGAESPRYMKYVSQSTDQVS